MGQLSRLLSMKTMYVYSGYRLISFVNIINKRVKTFINIDLEFDTIH